MEPEPAGGPLASFEHHGFNPSDTIAERRMFEDKIHLQRRLKLPATVLLPPFSRFCSRFSCSRNFNCGHDGRVLWKLEKKKRFVLSHCPFLSPLCLNRAACLTLLSGAGLTSLGLEFRARGPSTSSAMYYVVSVDRRSTFPISPPSPPRR